jgi:hypothetical protein
MNMQDLDDTAHRASEIGEPLRQFMRGDKRICEQCGHQTDDHALRWDSRYTKCVHPAQTYGPPEKCYEGEWVRVCPKCGAEESFDE